MNDKAVYRTAPATPGLLIISYHNISYNVIHIISYHIKNILQGSGTCEQSHTRCTKGIKALNLITTENRTGLFICREYLNIEEYLEGLSRRISEL